jgi:hypothetical protein
VTLAALASCQPDGANNGKRIGMKCPYLDNIHVVIQPFSFHSESRPRHPHTVRFTLVAVGKSKHVELA